MIENERYYFDEIRLLDKLEDKPNNLSCLVSISR